MAELDWEFVGSALLEKELRPVLVLDSDGRIVRANRALISFLDHGTSTHLVKFGEEWVLPQSHAAFVEAWERALGGQRTRVSVTLRHAVFYVPVFELIPLTQAGGVVRSVMMVVVDAVASGPAPPLMPPLGVLYEVSLDSEGRPDRLLRALSSDPRHKVDHNPAPCFRALQGRNQPCECCPLMGLGADETRSVVRLETLSPFKAWLLTARRVRDGFAIVSAVPIDEGDYSGLVQARIDALGRKSKLTERERHVLALLLMGRNLDDVANAEGITARTAKYHQQNLLRKLGAESRADLFRLLT